MGPARELRSSRESAYSERDGKSDAENVDNRTHTHHAKGERAFGSSGKWHDNAVHKEINSHAIQSSRNDRMLDQENNGAAREKENRSRPKCDDQVTNKPQQRRREPTIECAGPEQSAGDYLQQAHRLGTEEAVDNQRGRDVQNAARKSGP